MYFLWLDGIGNGRAVGAVLTGGHRVAMVMDRTVNTWECVSSAVSWVVNRCF